MRNEVEIVLKGAFNEEKWSTGAYLIFPERDILRQSRDCHSAAEFEEAIKSMKVIYGSLQLFMAPGQLQEEPPSADGQREQRPCR